MVGAKASQGHGRSCCPLPRLFTIHSPAPGKPFKLWSDAGMSDAWVLSTADLTALGLGDKAVRRLVTNGQLIRLRRGQYPSASPQRQPGPAYLADRGTRAAALVSP